MARRVKPREVFHNQKVQVLTRPVGGEKRGGVKRGEDERGREEERGVRRVCIRACVDVMLTSQGK